MSIQKSTLTLDGNGKTASAYLAVPENGGPGVLVLHAWWGLNPFFKSLCDRLAEQGFTALAPDLFQGQIATTIEAAEALMKNSDDQTVSAAVMAAKDHLLALTNGKIGVIGFSFGAARSLVLAAQDPEKIAAMVLFYGVYEVDFKEIKSKILGNFGERDEMEPLEGVKWMETAMQDASLDVTLHIYPNVGHWFVEADRPEYDPAAANLAWERTFAFLKENL
jgi:carboxymethylenebutenolidase